MKLLLTTVLAGLAGLQGFTLAAESRPKLVVGIMVDQLRTDYIENLREMFGPGGFRRLMEGGIYIKDVDFNVAEADAASATAILQTGAYPRQTGVTGASVYDHASKSIKPIFTDEGYIGNFTTETYSPSALRVATITDMLTVDENGKTRIHSISPDAAQAIVMAGHSANSAFWVNDETGKWSSTTYYTNPPAPLQNRNYNNPLVSRLDTMKWVPLRKGEPYPFVSQDEIKEGFKYNFSRSDRDVFSFYKLSPYVNSDITEAATEYITDLNLGKNGEFTDVLNLGFTLAPYPLGPADNYRYELEDAYLRLDKNLEKLFTTLDKQVGRDNVLVYLVSTGYFEEPVADGSKYRLPGGTFSVKRAMSLLNAFLAAKYGNGAFVDQFANGQIYLSKSQIEEKNLDFNKVAEEARDFLVRMSGVSDAFTISDLMSPAIRELEVYRHSVDPKTSGDIILQFTPGWIVVDDSRFPSRTLPLKNMAYLTPGFIYGAGLPAKVVEETVEATALAPTMAGVLKIRPPNAAVSKPLSLHK